MIMAACWSRGARSEVPETLLPTVPEKFSMPRATPYSVMEVPSTGMSAVAEAAAEGVIIHKDQMLQEVQAVAAEAAAMVQAAAVAEMVNLILVLVVPEELLFLN